MKHAMYFFLILFLLGGSHGFAQTVETHEFGETNVQWFIYSSGKTWEFEAENTMTVEKVDVKSVLASDGHRLYIEVSIEGDVIAEWEQYVNDVYYEPYYHSKQVSYSLTAGDEIVYKIYGYGSPAGGILGINYLKLTGRTGSGGEPNIAVSPDTLFFRVGESNPTSPVTLGVPSFYQNKELSFQKVIRLADLENKGTTPGSPLLTTGELDTLGNVFEGPLYMFDEDWQMYYEATRLVPTNNCVLKELRFAFANYASVTSSKECEFFVWDDNGGEPGALIWSTEGTITLEADKSAWFAIDVSEEDLTVDSFWMGHYEKSRGAPTSLSDSVATPGTNFYGEDGSNWEEDMYDYLHQAVVSYGSAEVEDVAQLGITNIGNDVLQVSGISCSQPWVKPVSSGNFSLNPGEKKDLAIWCTAQDLSDGQYTGTLLINSNDPDTPVFEVPLLLAVNIEGFAPPQNLTADSPDNTVFLSWQPPDGGNPDSYNIYRAESSPVDPINQNYLASVNGNTTSYHDTDSSLAPGERFYYAVTAVYAGNESAPCQELMVVVDIQDEPTPEIPTEFALQQNFPNPFNPETEIGFALPKSTHVTLRIYNLLGKEIRTLVDRQYGAGYHNVIWDGKDNTGRPVSSGVYLYQLKAGLFMNAKKMSLLR